jgi:hypothetical protein
VPLHIFEPRYRELIGECLDQEEPFGLVFADDDGLRRVGTLLVYENYPLDALSGGGSAGSARSSSRRPRPSSASGRSQSSRRRTATPSRAEPTRG